MGNIQENLSALYNTKNTLINIILIHVLKWYIYLFTIFAQMRKRVPLYALKSKFILHLFCTAFGLHYLCTKLCISFN